MAKRTALDRRARAKMRARANRHQVRSCQGCTECCTHVGVEELDKVAREVCCHVLNDAGFPGGKGCGIRKQRPYSCRTFLCAYVMRPSLYPQLFEDEKPDVLGMICGAKSREAADGTPVTLFVETRAGGEARSLNVIRRFNAAGWAVAVDRLDGKQRLWWGGRPLATADVNAWRGAA